MRRASVLLALAFVMLLAVLSSAQSIQFAKHYDSSTSDAVVNPGFKITTWTIVTTGGSVNVSAWGSVGDKIAPRDGWASADTFITVPANASLTFRAPSTDWLYIARASGASMEVYGE